MTHCVNAPGCKDPNRVIVMRYLSFLSLVALISTPAALFAADDSGTAEQVAELQTHPSRESTKLADSPQDMPETGVQADAAVLQSARLERSARFEAAQLDEQSVEVSAADVEAAMLQAEMIMGGAKENGYTRTLIEGDFYPVVHPMEVEWAIQQSLSREGVDIDTDERFSLSAIRSLASAIATVCDDMDCVLEALATGFLETRWRPDRRGPAGECGWAQQMPRYAYELPELEELDNADRCEVLQDDALTAVRQWYQKREYWSARKGERWPCYYNAGYICTASGQYYMQNHRRYYQMYEAMFDHLIASDQVN